MSEKMYLPNSGGPSLSDGLSSNEIKKKIKRSFFKEDVAVKSYKCDVVGQDFVTSAKLYISNRAFYVVHRPKRKKLTTMPFTEICNIKARPDERGVDVYLENESVYTFTRFQRPESAVAFLLNFWNMIRKEKFVSRHSQLSSRSSNDASQQPTTANTTTPESLRIPKYPTTISLNSSASISESDSTDSRRREVTSASSEQLPMPSLMETRSFDSKAQIRNGISTDSKRSDSKHVRSANPSIPPSMQTDQVRSETKSMLGVNQPGLATDNHSFDSSASPGVDVKSPSSLHSANRNVSLPHSTSAPTVRQIHGVARPGCTIKPRSNHPCLSETPGWSLWPLSFLPYPFSPPQRLTMIIAYAILGFLLFSTMHLYHRLAVFDLQGNPFMRPTGNPAPSNKVRFTLQALELQLSELAELTGQLAKSLMHMTGEIRQMRLDTDSSSPTTTTTTTAGSSIPQTGQRPSV